MQRIGYLVPLQKASKWMVSMTFTQYINHATKHPTFLLQSFFQMTSRHLAALAVTCMAYCILFKKALPSFLLKIATNTHKPLQVAFFFLFQIDTATLLLRTLFYFSVNLSTSLGNNQMSGYYKQKVWNNKGFEFFTQGISYSFLVYF